jgi:hypothetical protein
MLMLDRRMLLRAGSAAGGAAALAATTVPALAHAPQTVKRAQQTTEDRGPQLMLRKQQIVSRSIFCRALRDEPSLPLPRVLCRELRGP